MIKPPYCPKNRDRFTWRLGVAWLLWPSASDECSLESTSQARRRLIQEHAQNEVHEHKTVRIPLPSRPLKGRIIPVARILNGTDEPTGGRVAA